MKYLKLFEQQTEPELAKICQQYNIKNWSINSDGLVDVDGSVNLSYKRLTRLPIRFGRITGFFDCHENKITSLEGGPIYVGKNYECSNNRLTSLKGAPNQIFDNFYCDNNKLTTLEYCPRQIDGNFHCYSNLLTTLRFGPESVDGIVYAWGNKISDIPKEYLTEDYLQFIIKEQYDWNLYRKDGSLHLERLEQMIEWGHEKGLI